jgi:3-hydroxyacyl-CoA dehydrogenase
MGTDIQRAAVLGAGVMGSGIAAHLANAGIPVMLLDIVPPELTEEEEKKGLTKDDPRFRNKFSIAGLEGIKKSKPAALYSKRFLPLIEIGSSSASTSNRRSSRGSTRSGSRGASSPPTPRGCRSPA